MGQVLALDKSLENTFPYLLTLLGLDDPDSSLQTNGRADTTTADEGFDTADLKDAKALLDEF